VKTKRLYSKTKESNPINLIQVSIQSTSAFGHVDFM